MRDESVDFINFSPFAENKNRWSKFDRRVSVIIIDNNSKKKSYVMRVI